LVAQIEIDKASASLESLAASGDALEVPVTWILLGDTPAPVVVRASERSVKAGPEWGRVERVDGGTSRDLAILQICVPPGTGVGDHTHPGLEHHLIVSGRWRVRHGDHEHELGPCDYVRRDGTVPHAAENIEPDDRAMLIVSVRRPGAEPPALTGPLGPTVRGPDR
jgi:quercetin dioxygenase-like cupin family protein